MTPTEKDEMFNQVFKQAWLAYTAEPHRREMEMHFLREAKTDAMIQTVLLRMLSRIKLQFPMKGQFLALMREDWKLSRDMALYASCLVPQGASL
jgi:hypothetical protein